MRSQARTCHTVLQCLSLCESIFLLQRWCTWVFVTPSFSSSFSSPRIVKFRVEIVFSLHFFPIFQSAISSSALWLCYLSFSFDSTVRFPRIDVLSGEALHQDFLFSPPLQIGRPRGSSCLGNRPFRARGVCAPAVVSDGVSYLLHGYYITLFLTSLGFITQLFGLDPICGFATLAGRLAEIDFCAGPDQKWSRHTLRQFFRYFYAGPRVRTVSVFSIQRYWRAFARKRRSYPIFFAKAASASLRDPSFVEMRLASQAVNNVKHPLF